MSINFVAKNVKLPGALKGYAEKEWDIEKIAGDIIDAEVIINEEKIDFRVEISLKTRLHSFYSHDRNRILKQALRQTLKTIKSQARKNKEKLKEEKKRGGAKAAFRQELALPPEPLPPSAKSPRGGPPALLVSDNYSRTPISVEEAIFLLQESNDNGYLFINAETNRVAGVFNNKQGGITLIEPNL